MESKPVDCSDLEAFQAFRDYSALLRERTAFNETLLRKCQVPICRALFGFGVPDLSGIGAAIGYILSITVGAVLCFTLLLSPTLRLRPRTATAIRTIALGGLVSFFECAASFAFAVQIATVTVLAPIDLETKKSSFGAYEALLAAVVSTMTLLPLTSPLYIIPAMSIPGPENIPDRQSYRLWFFSAAAVTSLYPFFSSCMRYWAPSVVGEGAGGDGATYVTNAEWGAVTHVCFGHIVRFPSRSNVEGIALGVIHLASGLFVFLYAASIVLPSILHIIDVITGGQGGPFRQGIRALCQRVSRVCQQPAVMYVMIIVPLCLAAGLMWAFWMLRTLQQQLASTAGGPYDGDEWGFGQVMAITVFVPVGAEMLFVAYHYKGGGKQIAGLQLGDVSEGQTVHVKERAITSPL